LAVTAATHVKNPPPKAVGAAGLISVAQHELDLGNYAAAAEYATSGAAKAPILNDYAQYIRAQAEYHLRNYREVDKSVTQIFNFEPVSPLVGRGAILAVTADLEGDQPKEALDLIRKYFDRIPQPQADLLYARCFQANGDLAQAAEYFQRVYYGYPLAQEVGEAATILAQIKPKMGDAYPPVMPTVMLGRAEKLMEYHRAAEARNELLAAIPQLGGIQRDLAQVRLGEVDYYLNNPKATFNYLNNLKVTDPEADAERLYYLVRSSRRQDRKSDVKAYLDALEKDHPNSTWRMKAMIDVADAARFQGDATLALDLYSTCAAVFGRNPGAVTCNWRRAYNAYHVNSAEAPGLIRNYIEQFPDSEDTTDAIYFLGRWYEKKGDLASARAAYDGLTFHFPNTYFGILGFDRLKLPALKTAVPSPDMKAFLEQVPWAPRDHYDSFKPNALTQKRLNRAELLQLTGLNNYAEGELRFGARNDEGGQPNIYAVQLAKYALQRNAPDNSMDYIKDYAPGYLYMPLDQAPLEFWQLAFPIPFRSAIEYYSKSQNLDPYLVAALIRQESDFNVKELSSAHAYGLMQLVPETARELARHFSIRRVSTSDLMTSDLNIKLGTLYLRRMLDRYNGQMEWVLAAYNGGPGRADQWRNWGPFEETADLIEVIPLHETRLYVQIVERNADIYRRLYSGLKPDFPPYQPKPAPARPAAKKKKRHTQS